MSETLASKASAEAPRGVVASRPPPDLKLVMATQDLSESHRAAAVDRSQSGGRGGSIGMVLLVAMALVGAAVGLLAGRPRQRRALYPGAAGLPRHGRRVFAVCAGDRHPARRRQGRRPSPMLKAVVDEAVDGLLVTDPRGRVIYANAAYLDSGRRQRRRRRAAGRAGVHRRSRRVGSGLSPAQGGARRPQGPGGGAGPRAQGQGR